MLPVRVKVLSSASCSLSQASSLLQRFLSGDACSDSLARNYVANVAQALQDSISMRAVEPGAPSSDYSKLHGHKKHRKHDDAGIDDGKAAGSAIEEAENSQKRHKKKRRHSAMENGTEMVSVSMPQADDSAIVHHDKRRRKNEKPEREAEHITTENFIFDTQKKRKKEKGERVIELIGTENATPGNQKKRKKEKNALEGEHFSTENAIPDKERYHEKKKWKDYWEVENDSIELTIPPSDDKKSYEKKKRKKEKHGDNAEKIEALHGTELASPPTPILFDGSLVMKSGVKERKKRDAGSLDASRVIESRVSAPPLSPGVNENESSLKRKKKGTTGVLVSPDQNSPKNITVKTDSEALPETFDSEEKKRKKKKRIRKGEPEFD